MPEFGGDKWGMKEKFIEGARANSPNPRRWGEWVFKTYIPSI